jgi:mannose-1-phosphate guanylyltransferase
MILAAGYGSRLKPVTDFTPKPLIKVNNKPMIQGVIEKLINDGVERIVINTHYLAGQVEDYFASNSFEAEIILVHEKEILGTGGAVKNAGKYLSDRNEFLVYNVDVDCDIDLDEMYASFLRVDPVSLLAVKKRKSSRYLLTDKKMNIIGRTEEGKEVKYRAALGTISNYAFCGIHILSKKIFDHLPDNNDSCFDIIPAYMKMINEGLNISAYDIGDTYWADLGKP